MSDHDPLPDFEREELFRLASSLLSGDITSEDKRRLEELVTTHAKARDWYVEFMCDAYILRSRCSLRREDFQEPAPTLGVAVVDGPGPIVGSFWEGVSFAYVAAAIILTLGVAVGSIMHVSRHGNVAAATPKIPVHRPDSSETSYVGRVTTMTRCQWADPATEAVCGARIALGQRFHLASGTLEIAYDSGARVLLQGPVTYEVDATDGGSLTVGRLTAKIEKKGKVCGQRPAASGGATAESPSSSNLQSPIPNPTQSTGRNPLFTIKTPTAVVTDLGTEFGVEAFPGGETESRVFTGSIEVRAKADGGEEKGITLVAGQAARCERDRKPVILDTAVEPGRFVRRIPSSEAVNRRMVEDFSADALDPALEMNPPECYRLSAEGAVYQGPRGSTTTDTRGYIRTVETDYCNRDFTFEIVFDTQVTAPSTINGHRVFVGIGDAELNPKFYEEPTQALFLMYCADSGELAIVKNVPDDWPKVVRHLVATGGLTPEVYRVVIRKTGKWLKMALYAERGGRWQPVCGSRAIDLPEVAPWLNAANSRLFFGTGYCDSMKVVVTKLTLEFPDPTHDKKKSQNVSGQTGAQAPAINATSRQ